MNPPQIGYVVHYVSYGTPGGEYLSECRAAIVTAVPDTVPVGEDGVVRTANEGHVHVSLTVLNPTGLFFNTSIPHDEDERRGGTWHWPGHGH